MAVTWQKTGNWLWTNLNGDLAAGATSCVVDDADALCPLDGVTRVYPFRAVVFSSAVGSPELADSDAEVVEVTASSTDTLTVTRAQEGTTDVDHADGDYIAVMVTAGNLQQVQDAIDNLALDDLADVDTSGVGDGDALVYDLASETWVPGTSGGGAGDVTGPASSAAGNFPSFGDTSGKVLADSGYAPGDFAADDHTHAQLHDRGHAMASASDHTDWPAGLDTTELGYLNGVTGAVQTQLDAKLPTLTFTNIGRFGFLNQTETTLSFDDSTYEVTLTDAGAGWSYFRSGLKYTVSGNKSVRLVAAPDAPVNGTLYYVYIDATDGTLSAGTDAWTLNDTKVPVCTVKWNATLTPKYLLSEERHSCLIDRRQHRRDHLVEGTKLVSGGTLTGTYTVNTDNDAAKAFGVAESVIADEDLFSTLSALAEPDGATAVYPVVYRTGASAWSWEKSAMPFRYTAAGYIQYDNAGTMTEGATTKFYNTWLVCSNIVGDYRFAIVHGRSEHSTAAAAYAEGFPSLASSGFPTSELVAVYQLTWSTSASHSSKGKCVLDRAAQIVSNTLVAGLAGGIAHNSTSGIQGGTTNEAYHLTATEYAAKVSGPASAVASNFAGFDGTTGKIIKDSGSKAADFATAAHVHAASAVTVTPAGNIASTDVQAALQELDTEKQAAAGYGSVDYDVWKTRTGLPAYTTSQIHFEGADASTTITDANSAITWTAAGNAQLDTAAKKFGSSSLLLDGNGDWIQSTSAVLLAGLGTQDFTVDCWVYITTAMTTDSMIAGQGGGTGSWADSGGHHWTFFVNGADQKLYFQAHIAGNNLIQVASTNAVALRNGWHHVAFDRYGGNGRLYVDGTAVSAITGFSTNITATTGGTQVCRVGAHAVGTAPLNGWIDEFRLSLGVSRYQNAASFTAPTSAYTDLSQSYEWGQVMAQVFTTLGDTVYGGASGVPTRLVGSAGFLKSTGAAAPAWTAVAQADVTGLKTSDTPLFTGLQIGNADTALSRDKANSLRMATGDQFWSEGLVAKNQGDIICYLLDTFGTNLVGLWLGDQTGAVTTLTDRSLSAHDATLSANASTLTPDVDNLMRHLTLGTATLTVADHADFSPGNGTTDTAFSVVSLVYPTALSANQNILSKWKLTTGSAAREWRVLVNTSGSLYLECYDQSAGTYIGRTKASIVTSGAWQTLFATYSGSAASSGCKLYRNGVQVDDINSASGSYTAMEDGDGVVGMHRIATSGAAEEKFSGKVALVAYIKAEMTAAQCRALDAKLRGAVGIAP